MNGIFVWIAGAAVLCAIERAPRRIAIALSVYAALTGLILLPLADLSRAALLALLLALAIVGAAGVKHHHSGMKLALADLALTFAGTLPFMLRQYRLTAALTIAGAILLGLAAIAVDLFAVGDPLPMASRLAWLAIGGLLSIAAFRATGGAVRWRQDVHEQSGLFSFFAASAIDVASWWPSSGLRMLDLSEEPLPLAAPLPARGSTRPDIIIIQHESVFDPRRYGLPVEPEIAAFLSPPGAHCGRLHVEIFGGGSWQSEFSLLTGLSSASFGPDAYFLFKKGVGRFAHSLPSELAGLGYRSMLISSCRRNFLNYDAFYGGIGVEERVFSDDFPPPFDLAAFEASNSDAVFFAEAERALAAATLRDEAPRLSIILTNFNHGPHETRLQPPGIGDEARRYALKALNRPSWGEYYARLSETAASYARFRAQLAARAQKRPTLILRYGDHQPTMIRSIEGALKIPFDDPRQFETFFAIEALHFEPDIADLPTELDIAQIGTAALKASRLPLDAVSATRLSLFPAPGERRAVRPSEAMRRFHRTLVETGSIHLAPPRGGRRAATAREP